MIFRSKRKRKLFRKAQIESFVTFIVLIFAVLASGLIARMVFVQIDTDLHNSTNNLGTNMSAQVFRDSEIMFPAFDSVMMFLVLGLSIGLIITSFLIPAHPVFVVINIFGIGMLVLLAAVLSNVYGEMLDNPEISASLVLNDGSTAFGNSQFIMQILPWICAVVVTISTIVMYGKRPL